MKEGIIYDIKFTPKGIYIKEENAKRYRKATLEEAKIISGDLTIALEVKNDR